MFVSCVCCVLFLRRADSSSVGVLPSVCVCVCPGVPSDDVVNLYTYMVR